MKTILAYRNVNHIAISFCHICRLKSKLKRTAALLRDAQTAMEKSSSMDGGVGTVKSLRHQLEDVEFAKQAATKAKSSLEMELADVSICSRAIRSAIPVALLFLKNIFFVRNLP